MMYLRRNPMVLLILVDIVLRRSSKFSLLPISFQDVIA